MLLFCSLFLSTLYFITHYYYKTILNTQFIFFNKKSTQKYNGSIKNNFFLISYSCGEQSTLILQFLNNLLYKEKCIMNKSCFYFHHIQFICWGIMWLRHCPAADSRLYFWSWSKRRKSINCIYLFPFMLVLQYTHNETSTMFYRTVD